MIVAKRKSPVPVLVILSAALVVSIGAAAMTISALKKKAQFGTIEVVDEKGNPVKVLPIDTTPDEDGLPVLFNSPTFELLDQNAMRTTNSTLLGHPYVAAFIFTNCTSICPMMTGKMSDLQERISDPRVKLVSFTVDPARDTPEVLKKYGEKFHADSKRWFFMTGTKEQMVAVEKGFNVRLPEKMLKTDVTDNNGPEHSDRFILVDQKGQVRGIYDAEDDRQMAKLRLDAAHVAEYGK